MATRREDIDPDDAVARIVAGERRVEVTRDGDVVALVVEPTLGEDHAGVVVSQVEGLLAWAERFVADEAGAEDLRDEVDARRRQLRDELRLIEQGRGSSAALTGISGALLDLVRPEPAEEGLPDALDEVADGIVALGQASSDEERVEAGEEVVAALDHVGEEVAEVIEANGRDDLKASMWRTAGARVEEDFRPNLTVRKATISGGFSDLPRARIDEPVQDVLDDLRSDR